MYNKILITGGCGFIGSHFIDLALKKNFKIINLDSLSTGSNKEYSNIISKNYKFYRVNSMNYLKVKKILEIEKPKVIINFGAETHVDRSIIAPKKFIKNNIEGSLNLAFEFKKFIEKNKIKKYKFIHISTDEVYGSTNKKSFLENQILIPNSPYSASKASTDLILRAFEQTYKFRSIILRPSNNFGPRQFYEKLIPMAIKQLRQGKKIPIYGDGKNKREWLYVEDFVKTILKIVKSNVNSGIYNIGTGNLISNLDLIILICKIYNNKNYSKKTILNDFIEFVKDRPGHDFMYKLDLKKAKRQNLLAKSDFNINLKKTINYFKKQ